MGDVRGKHAKIWDAKTLPPPAPNNQPLMMFSNLLELNAEYQEKVNQRILQLEETIQKLNQKVLEVDREREMLSRKLERFMESSSSSVERSNHWDRTPSYIN